MHVLDRNVLYRSVIYPLYYCVRWAPVFRKGHAVVDEYGDVVFVNLQQTIVSLR